MPGESQRMPSSEADPSVLTTEQLLREVDRVKELMQSELTGMDHLFREKFASVNKQLDLGEKQRVEQKADTAEAVKAALSAAKEAVAEQTAAFGLATAKSEAATTKSIDQLGEKFDTAFDGQRRDVDDLKGRVGKIESFKQGATDARETFSSGAMLAIAVLSLLVAALGIVVVVILANA